MPLLVVHRFPISSARLEPIPEPEPERAHVHVHEPERKADLFHDLLLGDGKIDDDNAERKCEWLRSQIIGVDAEFMSPFGARRVTYADHTASGRCLRFVEDFVQRNVLPFYGNTHTVDSYVGLHTSKLAHQAAQYVKRCQGAGSQDILIFCGTGCTAAIKRLQEVTGIAVPPMLRPAAIECLPPSDRWVVFVGPYEHHSNLLTWRESLAEVVEIRLDRDGLVDIAALEAALTGQEYMGRPKLGSFSACSNVTGARTDTRAVARVLHEHGAYACFDFACSGPYVDIDMRSGEPDGYDAVFLSPHKFIGGPGSPGVLLMTSRLYHLSHTPPSTSGGGTVVYVSAYDQDTVYYKDIEEREDAGTPAIIQKIRAALAFRMKDWIGHASIEEEEERFVRMTLERISKNPKLHVLGSTYSSRLPVFSFLVYPEGRNGKHLHCRFVTKLLNDLFGIQARGGCACAGPYGHVLLGISRSRAKAIKSAVEEGYEGLRPGWTRISFAYYTAMEEAEFVLDAIEFIADFGHRFLPLYNFDWRTGDWDCMYEGNSHPMLQENRVLGDGYKGYMAFARSVADSMPSHSLDRHIPKDIDPQLLNFIM